MIHERLASNLIEFKEQCVNFKEVVVAFKNSKDICTIFFDTENDIDNKEKINKMDFDEIIKQIDCFKEVLTKVEEMNDSAKALSVGFIQLIISEFVNIDMNQFQYLRRNFIDKCLSFIDDIHKVPIAYNASEKSITISFLSIYERYLEVYNNKVISFEVFDKLKHINNNIVLIGANGSGKSTFSRNLKSILSKQITVIPSQQLLFYEAPYSIETNANYIKNLFDYQHKDKLGNTRDIKQDIQEDFTNLILALKKDEENVTKKYYETDEKEETKLSKIQRVWEKIVDNKNIMFDNFEVNVYYNDNTYYSINSLSDGEKAIIYYSGHIFFAEQNAYIIIDEPENHMHTALCDKLWNILEAERPDCTFIYLTHNLDFAVSRNHKTILWNKAFIPPRTWDFEELPKDDEIPERLMAEIVGVRKNLLFCEGENKSSIDFRLYNILFDNYTVIPMNTRDDVIKSVLAYNANDLFHYKAIGIVDRDNFRDISELQDKDIYVLNTNEVENILCDEEIIEKSIIHFCTPNNYTVENFKKDFFDLFKKNIDWLSKDFVTDYINDKIHSSFIKNRKDIDEIKEEFLQIVSIDIDDIYSKRKSVLESLYESKNYMEALSNSNLKKSLTRQLANKVIDHYEDRVLEYISRTPEIKELLINKYFSEIPQNI